MKVFEFDSALLPAADRLAAFRAGAADFRVDPVGDPDAFAVSWRLLMLGDLNAIRSTITPVRYRRDRAMIEIDGKDRIAIHCYLRGTATGVLDGQTADVGPGGAMVWDLARPIDASSIDPVEIVIVTLPRHMLDEVFHAASFAGVIAPGPALALAVDQLCHMIDHAETLPAEGAPFFGRAIRDLFAAALVPVIEPVQDRAVAGPLFRQICDVLDAAPARTPDQAAVAALLGVPAAEVRRTADRFGGLPLLIEQRRLLCAYRLLCDPAETGSVAAIAQRSGFGSATRFSRRFREVFHATPRDLRRYHRGNLPRWAGAYHVEHSYAALMAQ